MPTVNMLEAKSNLSRLVDAVEKGVEAEIVIARNGRPAARLVPVQQRPVSRRIGLAKGEYSTSDPDPALEKAAADLFGRSTPDT